MLCAGRAVGVCSQCPRLSCIFPAQSSHPMPPPTPPSHAPTPQGAIINVLGAGATMLALSATIGLLLAKTLTSATVNPFLASSSTTWNPVLAFDVFNVQARRGVGGAWGRTHGLGGLPGWRG